LRTERCRKPQLLQRQLNLDVAHPRSGRQAGLCPSASASAQAPLLVSLTMLIARVIAELADTFVTAAAVRGFAGFVTRLS